MVHILKQKVGKDITYLLLNKKPSVRKLRGIGFEHIGDIDVRLRVGQYTPNQIKTLLEELKKKRTSNIFRITLKS